MQLSLVGNDSKDRHDVQFSNGLVERTHAQTSNTYSHIPYPTPSPLFPLAIPNQKKKGIPNSPSAKTSYTYPYRRNRPALFLPSPLPLLLPSPLPHPHHLPHSSRPPHLSLLSQLSLPPYLTLLPHPPHQHPSPHTPRTYPRSVPRSSALPAGSRSARGAGSQTYRARR